MLVGFICPDSEVIATARCLEKCRMPRRCLSEPYLRACAAERPIGDHPSVTQLLNGTMLMYLRATVPYTASPKSRAFAVDGTRYHAILASTVEDDAISEERFAGDLWTGQPDYLEPVEGGYCLWDFKRYGSWRVAKFVGLVAEKRDDPSGEVYAKSGSWGRAGEPKQVKVWHRNPLVADTREVDLQLNAYRMLAEAHGLPIVDMRLQITVRDGGLAVARERGITELICVEDVVRLPDDEVRGYFAAKREALATALADGWTRPCEPHERWDDVRCRDYCEVVTACEYGRGVLGAISQ